MRDKKRILFAATQHGSFNMIHPVLRACRERYAVGCLGPREIEPGDYLCRRVIDEEAVLDDGLGKDFDLIVTGTAPTSDVEHRLWRAARGWGKKSFCLLDMVKHCRERFEKNGELVFPDLIIVADEAAAADVARLGVPRERISVAGSPYLAAVAARRLAAGERELLREELRLGGKRLITFCTEYIAAAGETEKYGYDELHILNILSAYIAARGRGGFSLRIRLHPRDDRVLYEDFFAPPGGDSDWAFEAGDAACRFLQAADVVIGMTSTILTEGHLLGLPVISFQPVGPGKAPHAHNRLIADRLVTTAAELYERLDAVFAGRGGDAPGHSLPSSGDPVKTIMEQFERVLSE